MFLSIIVPFMGWLRVPFCTFFSLLALFVIELQIARFFAVILEFKKFIGFILKKICWKGMNLGIYEINREINSFRSLNGKCSLALLPLASPLVIESRFSNFHFTTVNLHNTEVKYRSGKCTKFRNSEIT